MLKVRFFPARFRNGLLIVALLALAIGVTPAHAAGITVNSLLDNTTVDGSCTLREAIRNANDNAATYGDCPAGSGADTITFGVSGTITLGSTLTAITDAAGLTLDGTGQTVTISGNLAVQVMHVNVGASLTLNDLTIADGQVTGNGGGIINYGTLIITNSVFSGNSTSSGYGGGISNEGGTLTITNSTFSSNSATFGGGSIYNTSGGTLAITNSAFSDNSVTSGGGGGIASYSGALTITTSTFSGNRASGFENTGVGGGIASYSGALTITNSAFTGNIANDGGFGSGGINYSTANLTITNSTISGNDSGGISTGLYGSGGTLTITNSTIKGNTGYGIFHSSSTVTLRNTIVANNTSGNCHGTITNAGNNIDSGTTCGWGSASGSMSNTDPILGPLTDNGGPTQTLALFTGSPAIDAGDDATCAAAPVNGFDQRGVIRPQGAHCDIGAFEYEPDAIPPTTVSVACADDNPTNLASIHFTVTFSENVTGVDTTDFGLTTSGVTSPSITSVTPVSGAIYTVTINTGTGNGTIRLNVTDDDTIVDIVGNPLGGWGAGNGNFTTGEIYDIDKTFTIFLPLISKPGPSSQGIYGTVTENGAPAASVSLDLLFYNGASWSILTTVTTNANGDYSLTGVPSLSFGQKYQVRYLNTAGTPGRLGVWGTRELTAYSAGSEVEIGNFDIADIALVAPAAGATVALPYTFQWTLRPATPSDTYEFDLYDPADRDPYFYTAPPLGYVGTYPLNGLPAGFSPSVQYVWEIWVYSPDGGYGISYETRGVMFSNAGFGMPTPQSVLPKHTRLMPDLPPRK